ncbi:2'-5' RNA ligase family protein [Actinoplanes friuliensis]|uniref:2'-5' RNA ligase family protein n=1 Tax=Actinoplanes friuliensis DSM 7358 TaxID=1246995 RepID=U5WD98_9ACTN|nr:2'-5' RNA ligase family protein [Actinoplanes friuliensis]AGZ45995.1 hypothetical protein AFR_38705 [Actinoplanes friuliensis DSM 7358]
MRTVELVLDPDLDDVVRGVWERLRQAGLRSLATHTHVTNRPHLTLVAADALTPAAEIVPALPLEAELDGLIFLGKAVAWRVVLTDELRDLHATVWHALDGTRRNPLHAPEAWVPHISLALNAPDHAAYDAELAGLGVARGRFAAARSYDSVTRTVTTLRAGPPDPRPAPAP